jgi:hypothetical protein
MPITYEPIATTTLSTTTANIAFTSISQNYTDLVIIAKVRGTASGHLWGRWGNGSYDTGSNYSATGMYARSTTNNHSSERESSITYAKFSLLTYGVPSATDTFGTVIINIQNYSNTTTNKTALTKVADIGSNNYAGVEADVILWRSTSAINQIDLFPNTGSFVSGTMITLYGIKAA